MSLYEKELNSKTHIKSHWQSWGCTDNSTDIGDYVTMCDKSMTTYMWKSNSDPNLLGKGRMCKACISSVKTKIESLEQMLRSYRHMAEEYEHV